MLICTAAYNVNKARLLPSSFLFYSLTFARSRPNVASAVYSRTYLNGELAEVLLRATCSAAVAAVGSSGAGGCCAAVQRLWPWLFFMPLALVAVAVSCGRNAGLVRFPLAYARRYYFQQLGYIFLLTFMPRAIVQWLCVCRLSAVGYYAAVIGRICTLLVRVLYSFRCNISIPMLYHHQHHTYVICCFWCCVAHRVASCFWRRMW